MQKSRRIENLWLFAFAADFVAIVAAYYVTMLLRFHSAWGERVFSSLNRVLGVRETGILPEEFGTFYLVSGPRIIFLLTVSLCVLYALRDLYTGRRFIRRRPLAWNVIVANAIALGAFYGYWYLSRNVFHPRSIFATILFLNVIFCVSLRRLVHYWLDRMRSTSGFDLCPTMVLGSSSEAEFITILMEELRPHGIQVVARMVSVGDEGFDAWLAEIGKRAEDKDVQLILAADPGLTVQQIMRLLALGERLDLPVKVLSDKLDVLITSAKIPADVVRGMPILHFSAPSEAHRLSRLRELFATVCAGLALLVMAPLFALITLLIKSTSAGPVLFIQTRIGVNRKPFRMLKFRTMYDRADEIQAQVEEFNESGRGLFKMKKDPRVTPVGRFLRRFSLDELPQLINVLRGEMTLVGPRPLPERDFENYYEAWHYGRHGGLPGLTCLWQVSGRSDLDFHDMCILDLFYLRNQNWILDLKIVLRTVWVVLFAKGAY